MAATNIWAALPAKKAPLLKRARRPASGRGREPEVPFTTDPSGNSVSRICLEFLPPGGASGCSATDASATDSLQVPGRNPRVPATSCWGPLASLPRERRPFGSQHPCPWHYLQASVYDDSLAPTCFRAHLHRKGSSSTHNMASAMTDRNPRTAEASGTYTYTSRPRAVACQRRRYRDSILQP